MFSLGSAAFARASGAFPSFAQKGSKRLKKAQEDAKRLKKALEKAVRACPVPPVRSKRLFELASVPPVRSKRLFESAVQDHSLKKLGSATLCSAPLCSALLAPCMYMHGSTLVYTVSGAKSDNQGLTQTKCGAHCEILIADISS